jgi:putative spermidine/putrescine transport system permease protein
LVDILRRSFTEPTSGLGNYQTFFESDVYLTVLRRTVVTAAIVTAICLLLGYPYAYLMTVVGRRWRIILLAVVLLPFWTSLMVRTYAWIILLQDTGVINDALAGLGFGRLSLIRNTTGVTIGMAQILLPFMVLPLYATMQGIDRRLLQAAESLGARPATAFLRVYVPLSMPGVVAGVTLVFILALGFYITPVLLGSPQNALLSQLIVQQISQLLDFGLGGAMAAILFLVTLVLLAVLGRVVKPSAAYGEAEEGR